MYTLYRNNRLCGLFVGWMDRDSCKAILEKDAGGSIYTDLPAVDSIDVGVDVLNHLGLTTGDLNKGALGLELN